MVSKLIFRDYRNNPGKVHSKEGAWVVYSGNTASIRDSSNITSLTDQGTGDFLFTINEPLAGTDGFAGFNDCGRYASDTQYYGMQSGLRRNSTTTFTVYCGSNTTTRVDWFQGSAAVFR